MKIIANNLLFYEILLDFKSLVIAGKVQLPDYKELREGLLATQSYYGRNNTLSIAHERTAEGYGDLADATVTAVAVTRIPPEPKPQPKVCFTGHHIFVERNREKPFNWPHLVEE